MKAQQMKYLYERAELAKTGSNINCPACNSEIKKTTYQKKFCNPICKDKYWNTVKPNPASHYTKYNVGKKSYANRVGIPDFNHDEMDGHFSNEDDCQNSY